MKTIALVLILSLLPGCGVLSAIGVGPADVLPSLKYCQEVTYVRNGIDMNVAAKCRVPAG
jgi:hypothetical protein